jgi:hypothetical protein
LLKIRRDIRMSRRTTGINDTGGKFATGWKIMRTISDCWHVKVNLKEKIYLYVNSTTQRCLKKIMKTFLIEDFLFATGVNDTNGAPWAANLHKNFLKFQMALLVYSGACVKHIREKSLKSKISWHCPIGENISDIAIKIIKEMKSSPTNDSVPIPSKLCWTPR